MFEKTFVVEWFMFSYHVLIKVVPKANDFN